MKFLMKINLFKNIEYLLKDYFSKASEWFTAKSDKEKIFLTVFVIILTISTLYAAVLSPLHSWRDKHEKSLFLQLENLNNIQNDSQKIYRQLHSINKPNNINDKISLIKNTAFKHKIQISKIESNENLIAISSDDVAYQKVLKWLIMLENDYQIGVSDITISKSKKHGIVKFHVILD